MGLSYRHHHQEYHLEVGTCYTLADYHFRYYRSRLVVAHHIPEVVEGRNPVAAQILVLLYSLHLVFVDQDNFHLAAAAKDNFHLAAAAMDNFHLVAAELDQL